MDALLDAGQVDSTAQLTDALHFFAQRVADLHGRLSNASWTDIFVAPEFSARDGKFELSGGLAFVSGAIDGVRHHSGARTEGVDYELSRGADLPKEMVQVAIYRELLKRTHGLSALGALEHFAPALRVQELSEGDLDATYRHWVVPALSRMIEARQPTKTHPLPVSARAATTPVVLRPPAPALVPTTNSRRSSGRCASARPEAYRRRP